MNPTINITSDILLSKIRRMLESDKSTPDKIKRVNKLLEKYNDITAGTYKLQYKTSNDDLLVMQSPAGNNCLLHAISSDQTELASIFINDAYEKLTPDEFKNFINYKYQDPNKDSKRTDCYINTAITLAAKRGHYDLIKLMAEKGADLNTTDGHGFTALILLCAQIGLVNTNDNQKILETFGLLKEKGVDVNYEDPFGYKACDYIKNDLNSDEIAYYRLFSVSEALKNFLELDKIYSVREIMDIISEHKLDISDLGIAVTVSGAWSKDGLNSRDYAIYDSFRWNNQEKEITKNMHKYDSIEYLSVGLEIQKDGVLNGFTKLTTKSSNLSCKLKGEFSKTICGINALNYINSGEQEAVGFSSISEHKADLTESQKDQNAEEVNFMDINNICPIEDKHDIQKIVQKVLMDLMPIKNASIAGLIRLQWNREETTEGTKENYLKASGLSRSMIELVLNAKFGRDDKNTTYIDFGNGKYINCTDKDALNEEIASLVNSNQEAQGAAAVSSTSEEAIYIIKLYDIYSDKVVDKIFNLQDEQYSIKWEDVVKKLLEIKPQNPIQFIKGLKVENTSSVSDNGVNTTQKAQEGADDSSTSAYESDPITLREKLSDMLLHSRQYKDDELEKFLERFNEFTVEEMQNYKNSIEKGHLTPEEVIRFTIIGEDSAE